jgi:tetratricopeptide (TPR) repeat protein
MFDVGLIVLGEVAILSISDKKWGGPWVGGRGRTGGGMRVYLLAPANNGGSINLTAYVTEAPPARKTIERPQRRSKSLCGAKPLRNKLRTIPLLPRSGEKAVGRVTEQTRAIAPMLSGLCTMVLLALAGLRVNAASLTGVIFSNEVNSSPAENLAAVYQVHTTNQSHLLDLGTAGGSQNQTEETPREYEEALKTYRELAKKEPETYLPHVAATLNDLGILDSDQKRIEKARKEFEEALKTYRELTHKEPDIYLRYVAITLNNLGILEGAQHRLEEALKIYRELAQKDRETYLPYVAITLNNLGIVDSGKNRVKEARKECEEALKIYRELAQKDPGTYLPFLPMTLNNLGFLNIAQNRWGEARKEAEEALKIYRELAQKEPETYLSHVAITLNNLGIFDENKNQMNEARKEYEEALKIYEALAKQNPEEFSSDVKRVKKLLEELPR